jgi:hypothetical protein
VYGSFITSVDAQKYDRRTEKKGENGVMEKQRIIIASFAVNGKFLVFKIFFLLISFYRLAYILLLIPHLKMS